MSDFCCLLDACTVINLIHIDEDYFILKKMDDLDVHINETVFNEIKLNIYSRLNIKNASKYTDKAEIEEIKKTIDQKLVFFRGKRNINENLLHDVGENYFERMKEITKYQKKSNGELCSTAHALFLSRLNKKTVYFYTDDYPAKTHFSTFFAYQQIGHIKDSVDFLVLLYWLNENFSDHQLDNILSELYSQYVTEISWLKKSLQDYYILKVNAKFIKSNKEIVEKLKLLLKKLNDLDFQNLIQLENYFANKKGAGKDIYAILNMHMSVFELGKDADNESLLTKIVTTRKQIKKDKIYKWVDLLQN